MSKVSDDPVITSASVDRTAMGSGRRAASQPPTMRAALQDHYGSADVIRVGWVEMPSITNDEEVLLRVAAGGVDRGTWHLLTGRPYLVRLAIGLRKPRAAVLGREVAGTVVAVGSAARRLAVGDRVFGIASGSFAEYTVAKARKLVHMPQTLSFAQAAVLPISGMTALQAVDAARIGDGSSVLVIGASGGVSGYAVQIAKARGAHVTGICRAAKADFVLALGADRVIAYDRPADADKRACYDAIIDTGGDTPIAALRGMLAPRGTLVIVGGEGGDALTGIGRQLRARLLSPFVRQRLTFIVNREQQAELERLRDLVVSGAVRSILDIVYPLERTADAIQDLAGGRMRGKAGIGIAAPSDAAEVDERTGAT